LSKPLILAWTGPDFIMAVPVCQWLVAAALIGIAHGNTVNLLSMSGHQKYASLSIASGQVINVILSFLLIRNLGIVGVSMATFIAAVPTYIGLIEGYASKIHGKPFWLFYKATVLPSVIPALVMTGMMLTVMNFRNLTNLFEVAILEGFGIVVFGAVYWIIGFNAKERAYFKDKLQRALMRRNKTTTPNNPTLT